MRYKNIIIILAAILIGAAFAFYLEIQKKKEATAVPVVKDQELIEFDAALKLNPEDVRLLYRAGLAYYNHDMIDEAQALWKKASMKLSDGNMMKTTLIDITERAEKRKDLLIKKSELEGLLHSDPTLIAEGLELAKTYSDLRMEDRAVELLKTLVESHPEDHRPYDALVEIENRRGRILWAERYAKLASERGSNDPKTIELASQIDTYLKLLAEEGHDNMGKRHH